MQYFKFTNERIVAANDLLEAKNVHGQFSWHFTHFAKCESVPRDYEQRKSASSLDLPRVLVTVRDGIANACFNEERVLVELAYDDRCKNSGCNSCSNYALNSEHEHRKDSNRNLSLLCADEVQMVALEELGRSLSDDEVEVLEAQLHKYVDLPESITACIRERIATGD